MSSRLKRSVTGPDRRHLLNDQACLEHAWSVPNRHKIAADVCDRHPADAVAMVPLGYWRQPQASEETFGAEWFHSKDAASTDEDGYYWYEGRADERRGSVVEAFVALARDTELVSDIPTMLTRKIRRAGVCLREAKRYAGNACEDPADA